MQFNSELMKKLSECFSPSGREKTITELIKQEIKDYADEITVDALGNLIARKKGKGKKILFTAHMDQIGVMITDVDKKGFLRFTNVGGVSPFMFLNQRVVFENGCEGVVCCEKIDDMSKLNASKMYIDVLTTNETEVENNFEVGDMCVFKTEYYENNDNVICKAADNRIGCYVLIEALKNHPATDNDVYYVFSVQEEVGLRGAKTIAYTVEPDICIALDVTRTGDDLAGDKMIVKLGGGAAIKLRDDGILTHPMIKEMLTKLSVDNNIKYQYEVLVGGATDAAAVHTSGAGVPSGVISIPTRCIHTPSEIFNKNDVEQCIKLVQAVVK